MFKYIIRRTLYMIPTILGVIVLTFLLIYANNLDPAMQKLGKSATAKAMEDYDIERGYDKPLFCGEWGRTRAYVNIDFKSTAGEWGNVDGVVYEQKNYSDCVRMTDSVWLRKIMGLWRMLGRWMEPDCIRLAKTQTYKIPAKMILRPDNTYRWILKYQSTNDAKARFVMKDGDNVILQKELNPGKSWKSTTVEFQTHSNSSKYTFFLAVDNGTVNVAPLRFNKKVAHILDSQFLHYLYQISHLDFGKSDETNQQITQMMKEGIIPSLTLMVPLFFTSLFVAISLALICAFYRDTLIDRSFVIISTILMSVNYVVWIVLGQYIFGYWLRWFPVWGYESFKFLVLPCLIGLLSGLGESLRFYRTIMLDEMYKDYVRTAFAKGVSKPGVLFKHVLKNAMIPILTGVVMAIPFLFNGSLLLETFFGIPGLGRMGVNAVFNNDLDVIKFLVLVGAVIYVIANLITDICYALVDPRIKLK